MDRPIYKTAAKRRIIDICSSYTHVPDPIDLNNYPDIKTEPPTQRTLPVRSAAFIGGVLLLAGIVYGSIWWWNNKAAVIDEKANWKTYCNDEYGFDLTLSDAWRGYEVHEKTHPAHQNVIILYFRVPTTMTNYGDRSGYADRLAIGVWPTSVWEDTATELLAHGVFIAADDKYVFDYSQWQKPPDDLRDIDFDIYKVISTFRLIES